METVWGETQSRHATFKQQQTFWLFSVKMETISNKSWTALFGSGPHAEANLFSQEIFVSIFHHVPFWLPSAFSTSFDSKWNFKFSSLFLYTALAIARHIKEWITFELMFGMSICSLQQMISFPQWTFVGHFRRNSGKVFLIRSGFMRPLKLIHRR